MTEPPPPPSEPIVVVDPPPPICSECNKNPCSTCGAVVPEYRNMTYVRNLMDISYNNRESVLSTSMDILALYMQGQKVLFTESKVYCEQQLNALMLPAIFISALCTLLSVSLKEWWFGVYMVSGFAAANSFILAVVSYLKLDAKAEAHKTSAYQFDKLQTICEFNSGKILFFKKDAETHVETKDKIIKLVEEIETKVKEIKDTNKFILPESIRFCFKELYEQNIFRDVKEIQIKETILQSVIRARLNDIIYLNTLPSSLENDEKLKEATRNKDVVIADLITLRGEFFEISRKMREEVHANILKTRKYGSTLCNWLKT